MILTWAPYAAHGGQVVVNGNVSFWYRQIGLPRRRDPLDGAAGADVCIVGAGFTGLWTAYYLTELDPGFGWYSSRRSSPGSGRPGGTEGG